jgi:hypothetical protein
LNATDADGTAERFMMRTYFCENGVVGLIFTRQIAEKLSALRIKD